MKSNFIGIIFSIFDIFLEKGSEIEKYAILDSKICFSMQFNTLAMDWNPRQVLDYAYFISNKV